MKKKMRSPGTGRKPRKIRVFLVLFSFLVAGFLVFGTVSVYAIPNATDRTLSEYQLVGNPFLDQSAMDVFFGIRIDEADSTLAYWNVNVETAGAGAISTAMIDINPNHDPNLLTATIDQIIETGGIDVSLEKAVTQFGVTWTLRINRNDGAVNGIHDGEGVRVKLENGTAWLPDDFRIDNQRDFNCNGTSGANCNNQDLPETEWGAGTAASVSAPVGVVYNATSVNGETVTETDVADYGRLFNRSASFVDVDGIDDGTNATREDQTINIFKREDFFAKPAGVNSVSVSADLSAGMLDLLETYLLTHDPNNVFTFTVSIEGAVSDLELILGQEWYYGFGGTTHPNRLYSYIDPDFFVTSLGGLLISGEDYEYSLQIHNPQDIFGDFSMASEIFQNIAGATTITTAVVPEIPANAVIPLMIFVGLGMFGLRKRAIRVSV